MHGPLISAYNGALPVPSEEPGPPERPTLPDGVRVDSKRSDREHTVAKKREGIEHAKRVVGNSRATREELRDELRKLIDAYERRLDRSRRESSSGHGQPRAIRKIKVANGVYWVEIPEADLRILCGCPADVVKLLIKRGLIINAERGGVTFETGPNAILLSDVMIQNGQIANLAEFPVLQMLYRQGMLLPNHPNNTGAKPILIGLEEVLRAQSRYIYRGNYGLISEKEIEGAGVDRRRAAEMMRLKRRFAFDSIRTTEELIDLRIVDRDVVPLFENVFLHRFGVNRYEIIWKGQHVEIDLNLTPQEEYESSYRLGDHRIDKEYFSVVHIGEGDGWDVNRPCMASLLTYQDRFYLIDAGPKVMNSLMALGISINEIDGIFHTHAHDDHFAGLAALLRSDHRLTYYTTPLVRTSVTKKLSALMSIDESSFDKYFDVRDLAAEKWNDIDGLEVMPVYSPHPVETNIFRFRVRWRDGYRSYAHLADIASCSVLMNMVTDDPERSGLDHESFERTRSSYLIPADLKKIDIGGGLIHGDAEDFENDRSAKILLAHVERPLTEAQREIGSNASFGTQDVLIPSVRDTIVDEAFEYLHSYYAQAPAHELAALTNYPIQEFNAGTIMIRKGDKCDSVYLVIRGVVEALDVKSGLSVRMTAGSLVGETAGLEGDMSAMTYRTSSYVKALRIPLRHFADFIRRNDLYESMLSVHERIEFLRSNRLFDEAVSYQTLYAIAQTMVKVDLDAGAVIAEEVAGCIFLITAWSVRLYADDREFELLGEGDVCGEACMLMGDSKVISAVTASKTSGFTIPADSIESIPIVRWKLLELFNRRIRKLTTFVGLVWHDEYRLDNGVIDEQHRGLFETVKSVYAEAERGAVSEKIRPVLDLLRERIKHHFITEEEALQSIGYPELDSHRAAHEEAFDRLARFVERIGNESDRVEVQQLAFLKNWLVQHMLIEDAGFRAFVQQQ